MVDGPAVPAVPGEELADAQAHEALEPRTVLRRGPGRPRGPLLLGRWLPESRVPGPLLLLLLLRLLSFWTRDGLLLALAALVFRSGSSISGGSRGGGGGGGRGGRAGALLGRARFGSSARRRRRRRPCRRFSSGCIAAPPLFPHAASASSSAPSFAASAVRAPAALARGYRSCGGDAPRQPLGVGPGLEHAFPSSFPFFFFRTLAPAREPKKWIRGNAATARQTTPRKKKREGSRGKPALFFSSSPLLFPR